MFDPVMTIKSGQFHHWEEEGSVLAATNGEEVFFLKEGLLIRGDKDRAEDFFDEKTDYAAAARMVQTSEDLKDLSDFLSLRILRQCPWEAIVGFILSSNNNLSRIRKSVLALSKTYGRKLDTYGGITAYALPKPEVMADLSKEELRLLGAGYRDEYLIGSARQVATGEWDLYVPYSLPYKEAKKYVMELKGVGPKVADCILLFGYGKKDAFPVDVWIARAMDRFGEFPTREAASDYAVKRFGDRAGYVQQLLFMDQRRKK
ncbi:MAG: hypothetical protein SOW18_01160 [Peptoniphilus sp.]|nr:hypothetical protein [Peptoniphilus sp.]MDY3118129.1 hypothetical protein [Peptoniphilus sp.]